MRAIRKLLATTVLLAVATVAAPRARAGDCGTLCKALESMKRSTDRLCELAGESSQKCRDARARVAESEKRVRDAGCDCGGDSDPPVASTEE